MLAMLIIIHNVKRITLLLFFLFIVVTLSLTCFPVSGALGAGTTVHYESAKQNGTTAGVVRDFGKLAGTKRSALPTATWIIRQNQLPGTSAWKIKGPAAGNRLDGFVNTTYISNRHSITFYISTIADSYRIRAFRMGYYQGKGARLIWVSKLIKGYVQRPCTLQKGVNMISCDSWKPSFRLWLSKAFVQGDYLFELVAKGGLENYIPLTIWNPSSKATYVIKNDVLTWQAWNDYGGYDFYSGLGNCPSDVYPLCSRARVVSFDRPYAYGDGAADFLANEYPLVYLAEEHGLNVTYVTDITILQHPGLLANHSALLSLGHDECWSYDERLAVENAAKLHGLNVAFFGASAMLRHVRLQNSPIGQDREEVDYRDSLADPLDNNGHPANPMLVTGNTWSSPPASWPETNFVGETYIGFLQDSSPAQPLMIKDSKSFLFKNITYQGKPVYDGEKIPNVIASDIDSYDLQVPTDSPVTVAASSPISPQLAFVQPAYLVNGFAWSDMTYHFEKPSGALIFDSGTNNWISSMGDGKNMSSSPASFTQAVTLNLLRQMAVKK